MQQVLTVMHAFYAAKVAQVDPNFSFDNSFWVTYSTEMDFNKSHFNIDDKNWLFFSHIITWKRIKFNNHFDNIASKFVYQIQLCERASYSYCARSWRQQTSLKKKIFHRVENVIKQLVHTSAVHSLRYEALGKFREHSRS